ncbi:hypothetical protein Pstu01_04200 [Stutzerimonas stutzeri]|uniref:hypothetical protein n=1 Tax=Stutzerimonas stutzeri TaxID=316 RepID=UPI0024A22BAF|nr:hypothetical protein [Stutzerimonas stutzeri]GLZ23750.1 hypothetical protein Pstu01_04200 [Stutzerimonas stutzeri]
MRLGNYLRVFSALSFLLLWHSPASAENYYWDHETKSYGKFSSPSAACQARWDDVGSVYVGRSPRGPNMLTQARAICLMDNGSNYGYVYRRGTSCPSGSEYKPETGECTAPEENKCAVKAGIEEGFSKAGTAPDNFMNISSGGYGIPQRQGCKDGCAVEITDIRCKTFTAGPYLCRGLMGYTGQQCSTTGTGTEVAEDVSDSVEPETVKEEKPCVYTTVGDKQVCESKKSEENTGESCGEVNGVRTCVPKAPAKNGIDIRTEATTKTNPDGTTTTTKTDTATSTTCKGIKNCTTTTTTVTTTTTKNANGQTTGSNSTCTGPLCPNKSSNPDADGDGFGDCATGNCGGGLPGGPGGSEVGAQDWFTPGEDTFGSVLTEFSQKVQLLPVSVQTTKFLTFNASGACPRWSVSTWVFDFDFDQFCTGDIPWSAIAAVIIAAASFLAFRIAFL